MIAAGEITVIHCATEDMIADVLKKPLNTASFQRIEPLTLAGW
jgi:hypothetical protein